MTIMPPTGYENDKLMITILKLFERRHRWRYLELYKILSSMMKKTVNKVTYTKRIKELVKANLIRKTPDGYVLHNNQHIRFSEKPTELDNFAIQMCKEYLTDYYNSYDVSIRHRDHQDIHIKAMEYEMADAQKRELIEKGVDLSFLNDAKMIEEIKAYMKIYYHFEDRAMMLDMLLNQLQARRGKWITQSRGTMEEQIERFENGSDDEGFNLEDYGFYFENAIDEISAWCQSYKPKKKEAAQGKNKWGRPKSS